MRALEKTELLRLEANKQLDPKRKSSLGQFYTPAPICLFMASLFEEIKDQVLLLDAGCGVGSLTAAFCDEAKMRNTVTSIEAHCYDIEPIIEPFLAKTFESCQEVLSNVPFNGVLFQNDYILDAARDLSNGMFGEEEPVYSHVIMNPPYKKISSTSEHRKALTLAGVETVNLYTGFVALALKQLKEGGEMVVIIPRSFCNGTYYQPFRKLLFSTTAIRHIHIFESRKDAFSDGGVLQENIILHLVKGVVQEDVVVTSSATADFSLDLDGEITANGMSRHIARFSELVKPYDKRLFLHIPTGTDDQETIDKISCFNHKLSELEIEISTGPVVDFRLSEDLLKEYEPEVSVPLLYPAHFNGKLNWPVEGKKPNAIRVSEASKSWLWEHKGYFVITRRLTSKEEKRRIVAHCYDSSLPEPYVGFENKLNVFHFKKKGLDEFLAKGLCVFLNSTLLDQYYRSLGGHTQVNAGDLRSFGYPSKDILIEWGKKFRYKMSQAEIDSLIEEALQETPIA